ncbi:Disintegrin and metalloproteinase domain-containing protein B [Pleurostoma richardsiae]|uniref:Disintegrin and metalloproteinase domain-containing protein B n=1 Tax=Pleurostoma richardsiae TaxID=41990 RepID=A0AA38RKX8_9PEZI|nr:Disintegrin and metalloproteinase domain-containing protein B [Pleurostoma richardsiae]
MFFLRPVAGILATAGLLLHSATADSTERNPLRHVSRLSEPVLNTHNPSHRVHAYSSFDVTFSIPDRQQKFRLSLEPNHDILAEDATIHYLAPDGSIRAVEPVERSDHRVFKGEAFILREGRTGWTHGGWARVAVHRDGNQPVFEGAFRIDGDHHHIQTSTNYRQTRHRDDPEIDEEEDEYMVVWRDSDIIGNMVYDHDELKRDLASRASCTSDELSFNIDESHPVYRSLDVRSDTGGFWSSMASNTLFGRQIDGTTSGNGAGVNLSSTIGQTQGCPTARKVALVGIATDCTYTGKFNSSSAVSQNIIQQINSASQVYESTFNISLGIQNLTISDAACPATAPSSAPWNIACSNSVTITDRLNLFSAWRGQHNDTNAYWTLLSTCNTDSAVGLAWLGQVCVSGSSTSSSNGQNETVAAANVVVRTSTEWQVIAHETGHTFGAVHDCVASTCSDGTATKQQCCPLSSTSCDASGQFIMNPSTGDGITQFSPCSVGNICSAIGRQSVKIGCLTNNRDVNTITGSQCGNGIVESGEDCDCGGTEGCGTNSCCDPDTCKFTTNSVCDPSNEECCTSQCQFASNGTVCRSSTGVCDPAETCTGSSSACPADVNAPDGTSCGSGSLQCASGQCTSRDLQCKTLMGSLTTGNDTYACSSQGCQLSCASPEFGANVCYTMMQNFLDGTPCQGGGRCNNGNCDGSSLGKEIGSWIQENKKIVIPVATVVGCLILLAVVSCCWTAYRRRGRRARKVNKTAPVGPPPPYQPGGWYAGPVGWGGGPQQQQQQMMSPPPPVAQRSRQGDGMWPPARSMSARYA